ncbi:MAG TPA: hypothetical protein PLQ11_02930 [Beijerinckiaceae bacterium]|nr:hypothetical protein [Beijerinckiaceae bacterium]
MAGNAQDVTPPLTEAQMKARRKRSIALALVIGGLCVLFYLITVFKMGAAIMNRQL